jgi:DNA-directed RNA polymerase specialized sigma24 family protein
MRVQLDIPVSEIEYLINEWIYSERDRQILKRRLIDGITYERIAEEFDLSVKQTNTIIGKGTQRVVEKLPKKCAKDT